MKGDREKCLAAGASDYIAKPVNAEELLALLRIWLFGKQKLSRMNHEYRTDS
jgi:CheY-like chemotaxis protein